MAARGCFHSVIAFQRTLTGSTSNCMRFGVPIHDLQHKKSHLSLRQTDQRRMSSSVSVADNLMSTHIIKRTKYEEAIIALNTLQSNAETIRRSLENRNQSKLLNIPHMINYLERVGLSLADVDKLSIIHVTGTKGKGSTCAFAESILRQHGYKTGIFSSPHLIEARERISINGRPVDKDLFSTSFWKVYEKLLATKDDNQGLMPHYFGFLTVMAFYIFTQEKVDVALVEVGIGGQYDCTNVINRPVACGISSLDLDHTNLLGHTLEDIAWHKAGIFKHGVPAFTVLQPDPAMKVILNRSMEIGCPLFIAEPLSPQVLSSHNMTLGIAGDRQVYNAALAVQLCRVWLEAHNTSLKKLPQELKNENCVTSTIDIPHRFCTSLSQEFIHGLSWCKWPGRTQTICRQNVTYYLDGAHTTESIQQCVRWFQDACDEESKRLRGKVIRALVFNMTGDRPVATLLKHLKNSGFHMAAFCPNIVSTTASENIPDQLNLTVERETMFKKSIQNCQAWNELLSEQSSEPYKPVTLLNGLITPPVHLHLGKDCEFHSHAATNGDSRISLSPETSSLPLDSVNDSLVRNGKDTYEHQVILPSCVSAHFPCISTALKWVTFNKDKSFTMIAETDDHLHSVPESLLPKDVQHVQVLVTGSLHLVGGVLELLTPNMNE